MDAEKLDKIKQTLGDLDEFTGAIREMIEELEDKVDQDTITETVDTLNGIETTLSEAESALEDVEGTIRGTGNDLADCLTEIRGLIRVLEEKKGSN